VVYRWMAWVKDNPSVSSFRTVDFHSQFEWILFGTRAGADVYLPETPRTNLINHPKPSANKLHPTQKPVEIISQFIEDATEEGEIVFDPFGGSGTTLVACEAMKRACIMCEISPGFVDTIRKRWAEQVHGEGCSWETLTRPTGKS